MASFLFLFFFIGKSTMKSTSDYFSKQFTKFLFLSSPVQSNMQIKRIYWQMVKSLFTNKEALKSVLAFTIFYVYLVYHSERYDKSVFSFSDYFCMLLLKGIVVLCDYRMDYYNWMFLLLTFVLLILSRDLQMTIEGSNIILQRVMSTSIVIPE